MSDEVNTGSVAHSWRWFLIRATKHVPKGTKAEPQWKTLGSSFFAILQAIGQAANEDGTNSFLSVETLGDVGRCSDDTVKKVLKAAEAIGLIKKTANARGGRNPRPAVYACVFPLGSNTETGKGLDWERALFVLTNPANDRRLAHKRRKQNPSHDALSEQAPDVQDASHDAPCPAAPEIQNPSRDTDRTRHVTIHKPSRDGATRTDQDGDHEMAGVGPQPTDAGAHPSEKDQFVHWRDRGDRTPADDNHTNGDEIPAAMEGKKPLNASFSVERDWHQMRENLASQRTARRKRSA
jgi:hypothetical protein